VRTCVRNFVEGSRCLNRLFHLKVNIQFNTAEPEGPDIEDITYLGDDVSKHDVLDLASGPLALMRCLKSVSINGITKGVATNLANTVTQRAYVHDLPRMTDALREHKNKSVVWDHCRPCNESCNYLEVAEQAVHINDFKMFKYVREKVLDFIDEHQARERRNVCRHDPLPDEAMAGGYDEHGRSIPEDTIRLLQDHSDLDGDDPDGEPLYEDLEAEPIRKAREVRERGDQALKMLREIWRRERGDDW
jgi:hypothetical protein